MRYRAAAADVLAELAGVGFDVESIGELRKLGAPYPAAVPVLVRWLPRVSDSAVKEDIVRTLSVPWAREAGGALVAAFEAADDSTATGLRWAIGNALEVLANEEIGDDMISIATDRRHGRAREMVVLGLGKLARSRVVHVLVNLLDDEEVVGNAVRALGRLRATEALPRLEALRAHPDVWLRKEATKAIARIDKPPITPRT